MGVKTVMQRRNYRQLWLFSGVVLLGISLQVVQAEGAVGPQATTDQVTAMSVKHESPVADAPTTTEAPATPQATDEPAKTPEDQVVAESPAPTEEAAKTPVQPATVAQQAATQVPTDVTVRKNVVPTVTKAVQKVGQSHVDAQNFTDYFALNGDATYDQQTGIVTLTPDKNDQVGNFSLKSKIDMNTSFSLEGQVNLGDKTSQQGGADGIGFAFHNGNVSDVGNAGGNLGIGGLVDALGFKLDTWHNDAARPTADLPGAQIAASDSNGFGWSADPDTPQFGAFVTTNKRLVQTESRQFHDRWWAETDQSTVQALDAADLDGKFHDFSVDYDGDSRELTIRYTQADGTPLVWRKTVPTTDEALAMIVSASTGGAKNLQQFKLTRFDYQQAATVNVKYVDLQGQQIGQAAVTYPDGPTVGATYATTQLTIPHYQFVQLDTGTVTGQASLPATGELTQPGDNGTVVYVYAPDYQVSRHVVHETIHYVDEQGQPVASTYQAQPITFVTITDPTTGDQRIYYTTGDAAQPTVTSTGEPVDTATTKWTPGAASQFAARSHPTVPNYTVVANDAPDGSLTAVSAQQVWSDNADLVFTVVYRPTATDPEKPTDPDKPVDPERPVDPDKPVDPERPVDPDKPTNPEKPTNPDQPVDPDQPVTPTDPSQPETPTTPDQPDTPAESVTTPERPLGDRPSPFQTTDHHTPLRGAVVSGPFSTETPTSTDTQLPQTGEQATSWAQWLGAICLLVLGGGGLRWWRRH
ncbi:LPXTG cell wall anchor domain-containing protein [Levilactobacillus suantsaiihabitans]|uniref:LPXTG cell wall anchor domain-containing protein n=2 Tax=Levilactobacillus suantsaiihabitans TaxID=2487722 RepID=A0A4Z0JEM4_9LACO|nr:LPXTG cell wall anchor domain-containing protein [Levilactobacillus suantsaiihabitans]